MPMNLADNVRRLNAEIALRDATGPGAASAAANFERVGEAAQGAAQTIERTTRISASAERAYQRLERQLDPLAAAQARLARSEDVLRRAREQGVISAQLEATRLRQLQAEFDQTRARVERQARAQEDLNGATGRYAGLLNAARGAAIGFFASFSFDRLANGAQAAVAELAALDDRVRRLGAGPGAAAFVQSTTFALGQSGVDADAANRGLGAFSRNLGALRLGTGPALTTLSQLDGGDAIARQLAGARSIEDAFNLALTRLSEIEDAQIRAATAAALFGKEAGAQFAGAAAQGADAFRALQREAETAGLVFDDALIARAAELDDALERANARIRVGMTRAFLNLGPILVGLREQVADAFSAVSDGLDRGAALRTGAGRSELERGLEVLRADAARARARLAEPAVSGFGVRGEGLVDQLQRGVAQDALRNTERSIAELERRLNSAAPNAAELVRSLGLLKPPIEESAESGERLERALSRASGEQTRLNEAARQAAQQAAERARAEDRFQQAARGRAQELEDLRRLAGAVDEAGGVAAAERRLNVEREIAAIRQQTEQAGRTFDERLERDRIRERDELQRTVDEGRRSEEEARRLSRAIDDELSRVADDFIGRLASGDRNAFRALGQQLYQSLLEEALNPLKRAFADLLRNIFSGGGEGANGGAGGLLRRVFGGGQSGGQPGVSGGGVLGRIGGLLGGGLQGAAGGFAGFQAGRSLSSLLGVTGNPNSQRAGSIAGGAAGFLLGGPLGSFIGAALGNLIAGLVSKPSGFAAASVFDPASGRLVNAAQRDASDASNENARVRDELVRSISAATERIAALTGARIVDNAATAFQENLFNLQVDARNGVTFGFQGPNGLIGERQNFELSQTGLAQAQSAAVGLFARNLSGGDALLTDVVQAIAATGGPIEDLVERVEQISGVLKSFEDPVDSLRTQIDTIQRAFQGLDRSSGALADAYDRAIDSLAASIEREASRALLAQDNPALASIEEILRAQAARASELDRLAAEGGAFDRGLINEFNRRTLLNQFNVTDRFNQATDPVAASIERLVADQALERAAFRRAIEGSGGLVTEADFLGLLRAQEAERFAAFRGLSDEDKARLSGSAGDFEDITRQYTLVVERLIEESERLRSSFEEQRGALQAQIQTRGAEVDTFTRLIDDIDRSGALNTPGGSLNRLRDQLADLERRSLSTDEATRAAARSALPETVRAHLDQLQRTFASGPEAAQGAAFARDLLARVRDQAAGERTIAERQLEQLELSRARLDDIRTLLAAPQLDIASLVRSVDGLDPGNPLAVLALQLADLEARQTAQSDRLIAALEALRPADVGLVGAAASGPGGSIIVDDAPVATVVDAVDDLASVVATQTATIIELDRRRAESDARMEELLKQMATARVVNL